ncbi:MurR/RpiR family transcriptional regulator [Texcoconibacillus texcoconensis]|uniref:DNA-binding MurR/RpiR family transcriptional regulator n=1 Tax=Texcoconibacillus texcoconensis TaxID=1095777 RepID=A0A840QR95_9BACI|nr:MurR/RpiR family transcriptional regulator [Texcoconibacillus texcoconensis]MBB5173885.1 DNA-binding MurR/RpiR family transcriptional regulator [Texcoconibacillus texcoconensis]
MDPHYVTKTKELLPELTKGLKKVANQLLVDPMVFAIHPAKEVGTIINVSETMIIRFCKEIGYAGYSDLQTEVRLHLLKLSQSSQTKSDTDHTSEWLQNMSADINHIQKNIEKLDQQAVDDAIEAIRDSEKVIVAGYYQSFTFAHWFSFTLNYILGNAQLYRPESDAGVLDLLPKPSCILVFSFFRYALDTIQLAEEAKKKGIKVIAITDSWASPVTEHADIAISLAISENKTLLSKGPITMSLMNAMLVEVINRNENSGKIQPTYKYFIKDGEQ